jgi:hypothetical protein
MQQDISMLELGRMILQFAVVPIIAFAWMHYKMSQGHETEIAVMKSEYNLTKQNHDRELKEIKDGFANVLKKLDEIQMAMLK